MNIGIIGYGVVGKAITHAFQDKCSAIIYDPQYREYSDSIATVVRSSEFVFIAVPTPMKNWRGGPFDSKIIDKVMAEIASEYIYQTDRQFNKPNLPIIIIESAVIPGKIKEYINNYPQIKLVVCPEYLTEKDPIGRFVNPDCRILGGDRVNAEHVQNLFEKFSICKPCKVGYCDAIGAAVIKYMENSFLALKVSFMNQFYDLLQASGSETPWETIAEIFHFDPRMGNSHYHVPGHDGDRGYGGKCLVKDTNAICCYARDLGINLSLIEEACRYNLSIRKDIDWVNIKGAVSDKSI